MRASTAFKRIFAIPGLRITDVEVSEDEVVISVALSAKRPCCGTCGTRADAVYDHRPGRRWRHLDACGRRVYLHADQRRVSCAVCGAVRTEEVPFARAGARHTRAFETAVVWSVLVMNKTAAATLWRISWEAVEAIVARAVEARPRIPGQLRAIGVDERSWGRGKALTVVVDHMSGSVIWIAEGTAGSVLEEFFDFIGPEAAAGVVAVSMDLDRAYIGAVRRRAPQARICFDPFHVVALANRALDGMRRSVSRQIQGSTRDNRRLRFALLKAPRSLSPADKAVIESLAGSRRELFDAWALKEELADLYRVVPPEAARDYLARWVEKARSSGIPAMAKLATTLNRHSEGIVAAVETGLSNSRLEGFNAKIALINRRGYGHRNLEAFRNLIYLCCAGASRPTSPWLAPAA